MNEWIHFRQQQKGGGECMTYKIKSLFHPVGYYIPFGKIIFLVVEAQVICSWFLFSMFQGREMWFWNLGFELIEVFYVKDFLCVLPDGLSKIFLCLELKDIVK